MAAGDLLSLTVRDATPIDPDGGGIGANGSGWTADIVIDGLSTGGTVDPSKVVLTVADPGYDATGTAVTRTRTIRGTVPIRRQYPNNTQRMISAAGGQLTIMIGLDDLVYAGSTITAVAIGSGFYPGAAVGAPANVTNASTRPYTKPVAGFLNLPQERATGSGHDVELVAYHRDAMLGRQVACVKFQGRDAAAHVTAVQTAGSVSLSSIITGGCPPEVYKATIPLAALDQAVSGQAAACCTVNAQVYPWIGDATAVLDMAADGAAWPTSSPITPLLFCNDRDATYGGAIAYVKAGVSGGSVSTNDSAARAAPFATLNAAWTAIRTFNNASRGHNDHAGGTIYLMDDGAGGAVTHSQGGNIAGMAHGQCWTDVRVDPLATGAVRLASSGQQAPHLARYCCPIVHDAGKNGFVAPHGGPTNWQMLAFDGAGLTADAPTLNFTQPGQHLTYYRNTTIAGAGTNFTPFNVFGVSRVQQVFIAGCTILSSSIDMGTSSAWLVVGNDLKRMCHNELNPATYVNHDAAEAQIIANNRFCDKRAWGAVGYQHGYPKGIAIVQNIYERANVTSAGFPLMIGADGTDRTIDNLIEHHNLTLGERSNRYYADVAVNAVAPSGRIKRGTSRFNIWYNFNIKQDPFTTSSAVTGRVGNWEYAGGVGNLGNVCLIGAYGSPNQPDPNGVGWLGTWWDAGSNHNVAAGGPPVAFVDDRSAIEATTGPGLGDYHLTGEANAAYARVPAGRAVLAFDLDGTPRLNDGRGAAGPYERIISSEDFEGSAAGGAITVDGDAPNAIFGDGIALNGTTGQVSITGYAGSLEALESFSGVADMGQIVAIGQAPGLLQGSGTALLASAGAVSVEGLNASLSTAAAFGGMAGLAQVSIVPLIPGLQLGMGVTGSPPAGQLSVLGQVGQLVAGTAFTESAAAGIAQVVAMPPSVSLGGGIDMVAGAGVVETIGHAVTLHAGASTIVATEDGQIGVSGYAPGLIDGSGFALSAATGLVIASASSPTVAATTSFTATAAAGAANCSADAPSLSVGGGAQLGAGCGEVAALGHTATLAWTSAFTGAAAAATGIEIGGFRPSLSTGDGQKLHSDVSVVSITGYRPFLPAGGPVPCRRILVLSPRNRFLALAARRRLAA